MKSLRINTDDNDDEMRIIDNQSKNQRVAFVCYACGLRTLHTDAMMVQEKKTVALDFI